MNKNLQSIDDQYFFQKSDSQAFEDAMKSEIREFVTIFNKSFVRMLQLKAETAPAYINRGWEANQMNSLVRGMVAERLPEGFRTTDSGRFFYLKPDNYIILFKKLDERLRPSNNETETSRRILQQGTFSGMVLPTIFVGYQTNATFDHLQRVVAVYISNNEVVWRLDLTDIVQGSAIKQLNAFDQGLRDIEVTPKKKSGS